jgi:hypothetical protein
VWIGAAPALHFTNAADCDTPVACSSRDRCRSGRIAKADLPRRDLITARDARVSGCCAGTVASAASFLKNLTVEPRPFRVGGVFLLQPRAAHGASSCKAVGRRFHFYRFVERLDAFSATLLSLSILLRSPVKIVGSVAGELFTFDRFCTE